VLVGISRLHRDYSPGNIPSAYGAHRPFGQNADRASLLPSKRNFFKRIQRVPTKDSFYLSRDKQEYLLGSDRITGLGVHLDPKASSAHDRVHAAEIVRG